LLAGAAGCEKAIKAALVFLQADFPRRHDLDVLRNLLPDGWSLREEHPDLASLSEWSVEARYPGDWPEATRADASEAVRQADAVWSSVRLDLVRRGLDVQPPNDGDAPPVVTPQH
jgi:HEPN domain-containing protein